MSSLRLIYEKMIELWDLLRLKHQTSRDRHHVSRFLRLIDELQNFEVLVRLAATFHSWREAL